MARKPPRLLLPLLLAAGAPALAADPRWALCPADPEGPALPAEEDTTTRLSADEVVADREGLTTFTGDVVVFHGGKRASGTQAHYRRDTQTLEIQGDVRLDTRQLAAEGRSAHIDLASDTGRVEDARYRVPSLHARGEADRVELLGEGHAQLSEASYTTCPPGHEDWVLKARKVELSQGTNTGEAWDARVEIRGMPVFYLPYINFPLAGRKSGVLVPTYGNSDQSGFDLRVPYYFNLAPERDATLAPRWLSDRGLMLEGEYRYLLDTGRGQTNLDLLPNDDKYGDDRYHVEIDDRRRVSERWGTRLHWREVSDAAWFNDLDDRLETSSLTHLDRRFELRYGGEEWAFLGRVQDLQTLSGTEPYRRLPQLRADYASPARPGQLALGLASELTYFDHDDDRMVEGSRFDLTPSVALPLRDAAWFLTPRLALRHTSYQLDREAQAGPSRTVPVASVDSGAFFERDVKLFGHDLVQTLEPRLFYLRVPYEDQSDLPVFDTARFDFSYDQAFRENRFSGGDRVGDANQLTVALTSRLLEGSSGREAAWGGIGQVRYFDDRRVTLPGEPAEETSASAYLAALGVNPLPGLSLSSTLRHDPEEVERDLYTAYASYARGADSQVAVAYRYREEELEQVDLLGRWPLSPSWQLLGRWNYDLKEEQPLETVAGLEYQSCCWAVRLMARGRLNSTTEELDHSILLSLELKGLSTLGESPGGELGRGILR